MRFIELQINQKFTSKTYPGYVGTKLHYYRATCCTPEHNALLKENSTGKEQLVLFNNQEEIEPLPVMSSQAEKEGQPVNEEDQRIGFRKLEEPIRVNKNESI